MKNGKNKLSPWFSKNAIWLLGLAFAVTNIWLSGKLFPLVENIRVLQTKVIAIEKYQDRTDARLVRIENKIDQVLMQLK